MEEDNEIILGQEEARIKRPRPDEDDEIEEDIDQKKREASELIFKGAKVKQKYHFMLVLRKLETGADE